MISVDLFLPLIMPEVLGCPGVMVRSKIVQATITLCSRAPVWRAVLDTISTEATISDYDLVPPALGATIASVIQVKYDGDDLEPAVDVLPEDTDAGDLPRTYTRRTSSVLTILPAPSEVKDLVVLVSLKPKPSTTELEDFFFDEHYETIANGVKAVLMMMPEQRWSNANLGQYYLGLFDQAIGAASAASQTGNVNAPIRVRPCP